MTIIHILYNIISRLEILSIVRVTVRDLFAMSNSVIKFMFIIDIIAALFNDITLATRLYAYKEKVINKTKHCNNIL